MTSVKFHNPDDVRDSIESLQQAHAGNQVVIYWLVLAITATAIACLPLVKVNMSIGAPGQIRPAIERLAVQPAVAGNLKELAVGDNQAVHRGDTLLVIDSAAVDARMVQNESQREENDRALADLDLLLGCPALAPASAKADDRFTALDGAAFTFELPKKLRTAQFVRQHTLLLSEIQRLLLQRGKATHDLARTQGLRTKGLIAEADFEEQRYAVQAVERELDLSLQQVLSRWQSERIERGLKQADLTSEAKQLREQRELYTLRAPVDGTALGFVGLHAGLFLPSGQRIGEISPGGGLQADVYIGPRDIGFVRAGQVVSIQIDAFPYTEWGTIKGRVRDISQDFVQLGQQVAFKAVVDLDHTQLKAASGAIVGLRRGMTVNARFVLEERTLFNVLYGKLSESLDPQAKPVAN